MKFLDSFKYRTSVPFFRWKYPDDNKSDLSSLLSRCSVLPELLLGIILFASFNSWSDTSKDVGSLIIYLLWAVIVFILFTLALTNIKTMLLPNLLTQPLTLVIVVFQLFIAVQTGNAGVIGNAILGGLLLGGIPYLLFMFSKGRWIGGGDVKLGFAAGLLLGWELGLFCLGFMIALTAISILAEYLSSKASKTESPFRIGTGVLWTLSIFLALLIGQQFVAS